MNSYPQDDLTTALKWLGTALTLTGAVLTSMAWYPWNVWLLNVGSMVFLWWSLRIKETAMVVVNGGLLLIYLLGTIKSLL